MSLNDLSTLLWREREVLELLLYKLQTQQLMLTTGRTEWLAVAAREVEAVVEVLGQAELHRAIAVEAVGKELNLGSQPSLRNIARAAPQPWSDILQDHHKAFLDLASRIETAGSANKDLVRSAQSAAMPLLESLEESISTSNYQARGRRDTPPRRHVLVDGEL
jgi:hypothetical protein